MDESSLGEKKGIAYWLTRSRRRETKEDFGRLLVGYKSFLGRYIVL